MARRTIPQRRVVAGTGEAGARRTIISAAAPLDELALDDRPLALARSQDGRYLLVTLPYELWVVDAKTLAVQRSIALSNARPSLAEGWEGALWVGGQHLFRANVATTTATKIGSKLGGYVDQLALIRDDLLCGVGSQGELLWDIDRAAPIHQRKASQPRSGSGSGSGDLVATADGRGVFCDGSETAWVIDPAHLAGYAQLRFGQTSPVPVADEGIVRLGRSEASLGGRVLLGARDGAVAWTARDLRLAGERLPAGAGKRDLSPLALVADERWVYVLRGRGLLQRFLIAQPHPPKGSGKQVRHGKLGAFAQAQHGAKPSEPEPEPLPEAQEVRLSKLAETMTLMIGPIGQAGQADGADKGGDKRTLVLGGPKADGQLGRLWTVDPEQLSGSRWPSLSGPSPRPRPRPIPTPSRRLRSGRASSRPKTSSAASSCARSRSTRSSAARSTTG
jgi:hypothetical protein